MDDVKRGLPHIAKQLVLFISLFYEIVSLMGEVFHFLFVVDFYAHTLNMNIEREMVYEY